MNIFSNFCSTFYDFWVAKRLRSHTFLVVFQKSEILKNAVSERWCTDSRKRYQPNFFEKGKGIKCQVGQKENYNRVSLYCF